LQNTQAASGDNAGNSPPILRILRGIAGLCGNQPIGWILDSKFLCFSIAGPPPWSGWLAGASHELLRVSSLSLRITKGTEMSHLFRNCLRLYGRKSQKDFSASRWLRPLLMAAVCVCLCASAKESRAGFYFEQTVANPGGNVTNATVRAAFADIGSNRFQLTLSYLSAVVESGKNFGGEGVLTGFLWSAPISGIAANTAERGPNSMLVGADAEKNLKLLPKDKETTLAPWWGFNTFTSEGLQGVGAAGGKPNDPISFGDKDRIDGLTVGDSKIDGTDFGLLAYTDAKPPQLPSGANQLAWVQSNNSATPTSVVFTFTADPGFNINAITSGKFLFGSDLNPYDAGPKVPAPSTLLGLFSLTSFGSVLLRRRRRAASLGAAEACNHQQQNVLAGDCSDKVSLALN
jgi:hypothetical protein